MSQWQKIAEIEFGSIYELYLDESGECFNYKRRGPDRYFSDSGYRVDTLRDEIVEEFHDVVMPFIRKALEERRDPSISPHSRKVKPQ